MTKELLKKNYEVVGYDINYFHDCNLRIEKAEKKIKQIKKDIRNINENDLDVIDAVVHLAGLANDPLGELDPILTKKIKRFVYASSQSMYGISEIDDELEKDNSKKNPITTYGKTIR